MLCQHFPTLELELSSSLSKIKMVKKYNGMGVRAVPEFLYLYNKWETFRKGPPPIPQLILGFFIDPVLNNAAYLVTISGKNMSKCHSAFQYESSNKVLQYIHFIQLLTLKVIMPMKIFNNTIKSFKYKCLWM